MPTTESGDANKTWVFGKQLGWYIANWKWDQAYADHLISLGFQVQRSIEKPEAK